MFTGIIEETGIIKDFDGKTLTVECSKVLEDTQIGDSISVNGCCQTVVEISDNTFSSNLSSETIKLVKPFKKGDIVNLERALTTEKRLGGHIVQGHIDGTAKYLGSGRFEVSNELARYIVYKGAIAIDGISLTVSKIQDNVFEAAIISHTKENTNLKNLKTGDIVNIETDILGRYVEKFLSTHNNTNITVDFLKENGF